MKGNFKSLLRKFCLNGTVSGLKYFYLYPDPISRCFWALNMIAVLGLAYVLTWLLYNRFSEMPTRITIENQYEPVENLPYPAITICSPNQITISAMKHLNKTLVDGNLTINLESVIPKLLGFYELVANFDQDDLLELQKMLYVNRYNVPEVMGAFPQSCENFMKLCFLERQRYNCKDLFRPILTRHGLCCTFNGVYYLKDRKRNVADHQFKSRMVRTFGIQEGLTVVTDYNPADAVEKTLLSVGAVRVMYTDSSEFPADDESSIVQPHAESYHVIQATHTYCSEDVKALPVWSRKCYFEDEQELRFFKQYRNSDCDLTCYVRAVENTCRCLLFYVPNVPVEQACDLTSIACIMDVRMQMNKWLQTEQCDCPRDCESRRYRVEMGVGNLAALPYVINNPYAGVEFNKSTSIMHFFFPNSFYVKQKQETVMSLISLASNFGGIFGLCLGCSCISVLEIIFYTYVAVRNYIRHSLRSSDPKRVHNHN